MDKERVIEIHNQRNELVVKSNDLIRGTRYNLSVVEQKIVIYLISKIVAEDKDLKKVSLSVKDYCDLTGIEKGGRGYQIVKNNIKSLSDKSWWIKNGEKEELFRWIDTARVQKNSGEIEVVLSESLKPFLIQLKGNFTKYELINILTLHSKHSIRLYELFKSYLWLGKWNVSIDELKEILLIQDKYKDYRDLKKFVIEPSVKEINKFTDLQIEYNLEKEGRRITKINFIIGEKTGVQLTLDLLFNQEERLSTRNE